MISDSSVAVIIFIILLAFFLVFITEAWAEHEYFEPYIYWETERPVICIWVDDKDKHQTLKAIKSWEKAFKEYTHSDKFEYRMIIRGYGHPDCNVLFTTSNSTLPWEPTTPIGTTSCYFDLGMCQVIVWSSFASGEYYYDTIVHEIGHVMGLGHRVANDSSGFIGNILSNDVMFETVKKFVHITKESLDAIIYFDEIYPLAGNYTIPHNDTWADKDERR